MCLYVCVALYYMNVNFCILQSPNLNVYLHVITNNIFVLLFLSVIQIKILVSSVRVAIYIWIIFHSNCYCCIWNSILLFIYYLLLAAMISIQLIFHNNNKQKKTKKLCDLFSVFYSFGLIHRFFFYLLVLLFYINIICTLFFTIKFKIVRIPRIEMINLNKHIIIISPKNQVKSVKLFLHNVI